MGYLKVTSKKTGRLVFDSRTDEFSEDNQAVIAWYDSLIDKEKDPAAKARLMQIREAGVQRGIKETADAILRMRRLTKERG